MSNIEELSEVEKELYELLVQNKGTLYYKIALKDRPKLMGAVGKLVSRHLAKIERDPKQQFKDMRKKLVLIE